MHGDTWPLHYFGGDNSRGSTKGVSFPTPGIWPVAVKDLGTAPGSNNNPGGWGIDYEGISCVLILYVDFLAEKDLFISKAPKPRKQQLAGIKTSQLLTNTAFVAIANPKQAAIPMRQSVICDLSDKSCPGKEGYFKRNFFQPAGGRQRI